MNLPAKKIRYINFLTETKLKLVTKDSDALKLFSTP